MNAFHRWFCRSAFWRAAVDRKLIPWVLDNVELGSSVLEIGAGPGMVTERLGGMASCLTAVEIDAQLAASLARRMRDTNVRVVQADGTTLPFDGATFSAAVCLTMLHHIPSIELQDALLREVWRVLRPNGVFAGSDSRRSRGMQLIHIGDTLVPVDPGTFHRRLETAGFIDVRVDAVGRAFRFFARRP